MKPLVRELTERSVAGMTKGKFGFHQCGGEHETGADLCEVERSQSGS